MPGVEYMGDVGDVNSARTRVKPVFDQLREQDPSGVAWLGHLLELPERFDGAQPERPAELGPLLEARWYPEERLIPPPRGLLRWLVEHPPEKWPADYGSRSEAVRDRRSRLMQGDVDAVREALALLDEGQPERAWHVLEGPTHVDVYLETERAVIVIEGKRTEPGPTTRTTWMPVRHQMLRNLDAVWDSGKRAVGFFIVEAPPGEVDVPAEWREFSNETTADEALDGSLPHRDEATRKAIAGAFLGATTWQRVAQGFGVGLRA